MKKIAIMDTSISSFNMGDKIIMESARIALEPIIHDSFVVEMPTKTPLFRLSEFSIRRKDLFQKKLDMFDYKFVCGTNILSKNVRIRKPSWNLTKLELNHFHGFILVGVGTDGRQNCENRYTRDFYKKALLADVTHSVRDEKAKEFLESLGFSAINTGCVTLWGLNRNHCNLIPKQKSNSAVFTLTDYAMDPKSDVNMIRCILRNYGKVAFWIQGIQDLQYLKQICSVKELERIHLIPPTLKAYTDYLGFHDCDYIGTRLHAGIKALQMKKRSIIIAVDNRTVDMGQDYNIVYLERKQLENLDSLINSRFETRIDISEERISAFLKQFIM